MEHRAAQTKALNSKLQAMDDLKTLTIAEVEKRLESSPDGLTQVEAQKRLTNTGRTRLKIKKPIRF